MARRGAAWRCAMVGELPLPARSQAPPPAAASAAPRHRQVGGAGGDARLLVRRQPRVRSHAQGQPGWERLPTRPARDVNTAQGSGPTPRSAVRREFSVCVRVRVLLLLLLL